MKVRIFTMLLLTLLLPQSNTSAQTFPDLIGNDEYVRVWGRKYYQNVSLTGGTIVEYDAGPREDHIIGITCDSFYLDSLSSVIFGATSQYATTAPLSFNMTGTPDNIRSDGEGGTLGNGAGTYGGRGYNISGDDKEPYGSTEGFEINHGSKGTSGESYTTWEVNQWYTYEGHSGGRTGGPIMIIGNDVSIEGWINVNGESGWGGLDPCTIRYPGYSGSGGGILIAAKNLTIADTARITANGGEYAIREECTLWGIPYHYHEQLIGKRDGGGGRIKIFYEEGSISPGAVIEAKGWENGTVHIQQVRSIDQLLNPGDLNGDGVTNHEDLFLLQQSWQQELTPIPSPEETPTPTQ